LSDATVFSQTRRVVFAKPVSGIGLEKVLRDFLGALGEPLSYNGVILGHIKVMVRIPASEDLFFLSLTKLDRVDIKTSPTYSRTDDNNIDSIELTINVLLFGYSRSTVEKTIGAALALMPLA